jgi:hypothetical protein
MCDTYNWRKTSLLSSLWLHLFLCKSAVAAGLLDNPRHRLFLACFPYFEKMKVGICDLHAVYVSPPPIHFWMAESIFMKLGIYIVAPELISAAYFINPSHQSVCDSWPEKEYRCQTGIFMEGLRRSKKVFNQDRQYSGPNSNRAPPEYKSEALPTEPHSSSPHFIN